MNNKLLKFMLAAGYMILSTLLFSQKVVTDSLFKQLSKSKSDSQELVLLNEITKHLSRSYPDSALIFAEKATKIALKLNDLDGLAENYKFIGNIYFRKDTFLATNQYYKKALRIFEQTNNILGQAKIYNNLGALNKTKGNYVDALQYYHKSLEMRETINDRQGMGKTFNNIGNVHFSKENYDLALDYYKKSLNIRKEFNDQLGIAGCYSNMGLIYDKMDEHETAINLYLKSMAIYQKYEDIMGIGENYKKIALSYLGLNEFNKALTYLRNSLEIQLELGDKIGEADTYAYMAEAYNKQVNYNFGLTYAKKSIEIGESLNNLNTLKIAYKQCQISYEGLNKFEQALYFHKLLLQAHDSVFNLEKSKALDNLEAKFQADYHKLEIESLKQDNELKNLKLRRFKGQRLFFLLIISIAFFIIFFLFYTRRRLQRKNQTIFDQNEEITVQKEELEKYRNHLELIVQERTAAFLEQKEKAEKSDQLKTAFLANMSHEIRTPLNAIVGFSNMFTFDDLKKEDTELYAKLIQSNSYVLINLINDIIDIAKIESDDFTISKSIVNVNDLVTEVVQSFGQLLEVDTSKSIELIYKCDSSTIKNFKTDDTRLRQVLNNLIGNAIKFTDSGYIKICYEIVDNEFQFSVEDSGIGIKPEDIESIFERFNKIETSSDKFYRGTGIGLSISKHIVELLGGKIWVESEFGKGSTFFVRLPI